MVSQIPRTTEPANTNALERLVQMAALAPQVPICYRQKKPINGLALTQKEFSLITTVLTTVLDAFSSRTNGPVWPKIAKKEQISYEEAWLTYAEVERKQSHHVCTTKGWNVREDITIMKSYFLYGKQLEFTAKMLFNQNVISATQEEIQNRIQHIIQVAKRVLGVNHVEQKIEWLYMRVV